MHVLREVVREAAARARGRCAAVGVAGEGVARDDVQVEEEAGDERGDERRGGAEAGLVHLGQADARMAEWRELRERGKCGRKAAGCKLSKRR